MPSLSQKALCAAMAIAFLLAGVQIATRAGQGPSPSVLTWTVQKSGTDAGLRGISTVDEKIAWASGSKGTVLMTEDGGKTWVRKPVPGADSLDFRDIQAFSADSASVLAIGKPARIFKTVDGGETWRETYTNDSPGIFLDAFAWFDDQTSFALGDPIDGRFVLLTTSQSDRIWSFMPEAYRPVAEKGEGAFAASGTCLFVRADRVVRDVRDNRVDRVGRAGGDVWFVTGGTVSRIFHSRDWGKTWDVVPSPLLSGQASFGSYSIVFLDDKIGLVVGGDYRNEAASDKNAAWTADGGKTWTLVKEKQPGGFRECVAFAPGSAPNLAVTVGPSGSDVSTDLGRTWAPIAGPAGFHSLSFAGSGRAAWAVGKNGLIARLEF
jgi:photosystem II stability/assembly factor-like uncharacterized protein